MTAMEYHDMANEIRSLIPLLIHPQAAADLRSLAKKYERLADYLEMPPGDDLLHMTCLSKTGAKRVDIR